MHAPGDVLAGRYRVDSILGTGGMGGVYQATQLALDKPFAIKEMLVVIPNPKLREAATRQFRLEAQILHSLEHPGLPRLYDFFEDEGKQYLVMELVRGATLESMVSRNPVSEAQALRWLHEICAVLNYLHTHDPQVIFRDLKPSNIMLTIEGHIKLIDFGIAKVWDAPDEDTLTRTGVRGICTPGFAAPEQYGSGTDARTDIYALGATMYSILTHTIPPQSVDLVSGRASMPAMQTVRPDVSDKMATTVDWMMKLSMADRPQTILEVMETFGFNPLLSPLDYVAQTDSRFWLGQNLTQLPSGGSTRTRKRPLAGNWMVPVVVMVGAGVVGLAFIGWKAFGKASPVAQPTVSTVKLMVTADPDDTKLFDNGTFKRIVGKDGLLCEFAPGHHVLTFAREGYVESRKEVDVRPDKTDSVHVILKPLKGHLHVDGTPHARLLLDKQTVGQIPFDGELDVGVRHTLTAELEGYKPSSTPFVMAAQEDVTLKLAPIPVVTPTPQHYYRPQPTPQHHKVPRKFKWPFGFGKK